MALAKGVAAPVEANATVEAKAIAASLLTGHHKALLLGNSAAAHPQAESLLALANWIADQVGATCGFLGAAANSVGAQLVNAQPGVAGLSATQMLGPQPRKAVLLLGTEAVLDAADPQAARAALDRAQMVVSFSPFADANLDVADVLLPVAPFSETSGTFVNAEGRVQSFHGVVKPLAETRPGWKVLRVLGSMLGVPGFGFESSEEVKAEALGDLGQLPQRLSNVAGGDAATAGQGAGAFERIADVPIYSADSLVRRAEALQRTADAAPPAASLPTALWQQLGLQSGDKVRVSQGAGSVVLPARLDATLAAGVVRVPAGHADTVALGAMFGPIDVVKA